MTTERTRRRVAVVVFGEADGYDNHDAADALAMNLRHALGPDPATGGRFGDFRELSLTFLRSDGASSFTSSAQPVAVIPLAYALGSGYLVGLVTDKAFDEAGRRST